MPEILNLVKKAPLIAGRRIISNTPFLRNYRLNHYATYKFWGCKFKQKLNILKPDFVQWLATYNCNFNCKHCEAGAGRTGTSELTTDEVLKLVADIGEMEVKRILISGGEPLIRKDIFRIVHYILERGMQYGIASNGYLVKEFKEDFSSMKPYLFWTSIDGLERTNDEIRGKKGAFRNCFEALEFFKSIGVKNRIVNTVVFPGNIEELLELKKIIANLDAVTSWKLTPVIPVGRAKENEKMNLTKEQMRYLLDFVKNSRKEINVEIKEDAGYLGCFALSNRSKPFFCGAGLTRCSVMPDGEVLGCQIAYDNRFSEGNVKFKSFKEIWKKGFSRFRNPQFIKVCLDCQYFDSCRGGCWGMRLGNRHCLKEIWE